MTLYETTLFTYLISPCPADHPDYAHWLITVSTGGGAPTGQWIIRWEGEVLAADGTWTAEHTIPRSLVPSRWTHDLGTALQLARAAVPALTFNGRTFADWEAWRARQRAADSARCGSCCSPLGGEGGTSVDPAGAAMCGNCCAPVGPAGVGA